tara:strand:- start:35 stop:457 length:423 start_codon:yes stop_codon:yes gene_type:complete
MGYALKPSKHKTESGYAGVARQTGGLRDRANWRAQIFSPEQLSLGTFARPEQAALAIAKHRAQEAGQSNDGEDSEGVEEQEEEEEVKESANRPTEVRLLLPQDGRPLARAALSLHATPVTDACYAVAARGLHTPAVQAEL